MTAYNPIGGYFGLELRRGKCFYPDLLALNSGRNCFEHILAVNKYQKVYVPYYTCDVMLEPLMRHEISFEFYHIDKYFEPVEIPNLGSNEAFIYTNYFGLKGNFLNRLSKQVENLIVDNSQAFFDEPLQGVDTFYSPRKFFGVPDGGYVSSKENIEDNYPIDQSVSRCSHLLKRIDEGAEAGYSYFKSNDASLSKQPIKQMSLLTKAILESIDYEHIRQRRTQNFLFLKSQLDDVNELDFPSAQECVPLVYPFLADMPHLRKKLLAEKVFCAQYWPNVLNWVQEESVEFRYVNEIIHIPLDQRYKIDELFRIVKIIKY